MRTGASVRDAGHRIEVESERPHVDCAHHLRAVHGRHRKKKKKKKKRHVIDFPHSRRNDFFSSCCAG